MAFSVSELLGDTHPQGVHFTEINLINPKHDGTSYTKSSAQCQIGWG